MIRLVPLNLSIEVPANEPDEMGRSSTAFAQLSRGRMARLAQAMPDCQSAVLACLVWQATLHERMRKGPLAGRTVASLSGPQLAKMTGCPLRTVRHAISRLTSTGTIGKEKAAAERKNVYTLSFFTGTGQDARAASPSLQTQGDRLSSDAQIQA